MRLLDRYLLRELLIPLGYCLGGFLIFWVSFDLFSQLSEFQEKKLHLADVAEYYLAKLPEIFVLVLPIALLLASLYALTNHGRHQELTAMRAAGVALWRVSLPYLAVGLGSSLLLAVVNEGCVPAAAAAAEQILVRRLPRLNGGDQGQWFPNLKFQNARDARFWRADAYNTVTHEMKSPHVDWRLRDGTRRDIFADTAIYTNRSWTFYVVREFQYPADPTGLPTALQTNCLVIPEFGETPALIRGEIKIGSLSGIKAAKKPRLSVAEILGYLKLHTQLDDRQSALLYTQLNGRLAEPWTCLVVVLIAMPFGAPAGRRNAFVGVASSIFICFAYFILMRFGLALGTGGYIPPWVAAWLPGILFAGLGICLTQRLR